MQQGKVFRTLDFMEAATGIRKIRFDTITTANILYFLPYASNTDYIAFGDGSSLLDMKFFGAATTKHLLWDASLDKFIATGAVGIELSTTSWFLLPVKATESAVQGRIWYDSDDNYIHFYGTGATGGCENKITGCISATGV